jgi:hypothetical protein
LSCWMSWVGCGKLRTNVCSLDRRLKGLSLGWRRRGTSKIDNMGLSNLALLGVRCRCWLRIVLLLHWVCLHSRCPGGRLAAVSLGGLFTCRWIGLSLLLCRLRVEVRIQGVLTGRDLRIGYRGLTVGLRVCAVHGTCLAFWLPCALHSVSATVSSSLILHTHCDLSRDNILAALSGRSL